MKLSGIITVPFHIGDFLSGTMHMDTLEKGAYIMLLLAHYQAGEIGLPYDDKKLSRIAGVSMKTWERIKPTVMEKFDVVNSFASQKAVIECLQRVHDKSSKQRIKALKRHNAGDAVAEPQQCQPKPKPKPIDNTNVLSPLTPKLFDDFWQAYPRQRRGSKDKALASYKAAIKRGNTEQQILEGVKRYAASSDVARGYAKGCAAWLNDDGFNNDYQPMGSQAGNATRGNRGFDALAVAATKIQESMDRDDELLRQTNPVLYYQRLANQSGRENSIAGSLEAPNTIEHDAAPIGIGYRQED